MCWDTVISNDVCDFSITVYACTVCFYVYESVNRQSDCINVIETQGKSVAILSRSYLLLHDIDDNFLCFSLVIIFID